MLPAISSPRKPKEQMKTMMMLAAVFAVGVMMTTGCSTCCKKDGAETKTAMSCNGSCCKDAASCAKCCKDEAGCKKCCPKS